MPIARSKSSAQEVPPQRVRVRGAGPDRGDVASGRTSASAGPPAPPAGRTSRTPASVVRGRFSRGRREVAGRADHGERVPPGVERPERVGRRQALARGEARLVGARARPRVLHGVGRAARADAPS